MKDLFSEDILDKNSLSYDLLRQGETIKSERIVIRKDGGLISVEMNSKIMPDGSYQSFFRDISERNRNKKDLESIAMMWRPLTQVLHFECMQDFQKFASMMTAAKNY